MQYSNESSGKRGTQAPCILDISSNKLIDDGSALLPYYRQELFKLCAGSINYVPLYLYIRTNKIGTTSNRLLYEKKTRKGKLFCLVRRQNVMR